MSQFLDTQHHLMFAFFFDKEHNDSKCGSPLFFLNPLVGISELSMQRLPLLMHT
jgi:hypothetical protein